ncbi:MAG: acetylornithine transaminase [Halobacteriales archaeon]|nr:acetylornithine transaminase [Halobacteriales archaeon]
MAFERTLRFDFPSVWGKSMAPNYSAPELFLERGSGCWVWDVQGNKYLDMLAGIAVLSLGHAHPAVTRAIQQQAEQLTHVSNLYGNLPALRLAHRLTEATGLGKVLFLNSGTEANEAAIKLARKWGAGKGWPAGKIIAFENSFHGRTLGSLAATGQPKYWHGFEPLPEGFTHVRFNDLEAVNAAITKDSIAVLWEPVQGEGGVLPSTRTFAQGLRRLCDEHGLLLIADEVQTGVGRSGSFLASQALGVQPDIVTLGKGIGGGVPLAAMLAKDEVASSFAPGDHGCTFGGGPLCTAAGLAVMDAMDEEHVLAHVDTVAPVLEAALRKELGLHATEVRGLGLLLGVKLQLPLAKRVKAIAQQKGVLVGSIGDDVLRLAPPLIISEEEAKLGAHVLGEAVKAAAKEHAKQAQHA